jgi:hypothetical protein
LGKLGLKTLTGISTRALKGADATYTALEDKIEGITDAAPRQEDCLDARHAGHARRLIIVKFSVRPSLMLISPNSAAVRQ